MTRRRLILWPRRANDGQPMDADMARGGRWVSVTDLTLDLMVEFGRFDPITTMLSCLQGCKPRRRPRVYKHEYGQIVLKRPRIIGSSR